MECNILWLYHDMKDVFGDTGNLQVLKKRCQMRNIQCTITTCGIGEDVDMTDYDIVYFGTNISGLDTTVMQDLMKRKQKIQAAMKKGVFFLLVCGGFQAFGKAYLFEDKTIPALGIFDYESDYRKATGCIGNVYVSSPLVQQPIIGFENHNYQIKNVSTPLGKVLLGKGNDQEHQQEGFLQDCLIATNLHGPLLPKNPELADKILELSLSRRYPDVLIEPIEDTLEEKAREALQKRFK